MALIVLSRDHAGKPGNRGDRGATADLDGDGRVEQWEREAMLTPRYLLAAEAALLDSGHDVICISDGSYFERHARACTYRADIYIAAHLNAGGGDKGVAFYDRRSSRGKLLAGLIAAQLGKHCPELRQYTREECWDDRSADTPWLWRPWSTIAGVYSGTPTGICYEPCFMDQAKHAPLLTHAGLDRLGYALAEGIITWLRG